MTNEANISALKPDPVSARLWFLVAREARKAVVFRRGPSRQVLCLSWSLETDIVEQGQWFKGRIYERRCDLTPDGAYLTYFAAKHRGDPGTWTAVSRPPWLSAISFFPKGDAWGGGGLFADNKTLHLNHSEPVEVVEPPLRSSQKKRDKKTPRYMREPAIALPWTDRTQPAVERNKRFRVVRLPFAGCGEDDPISATRLQRDGWQFVEGQQLGGYREDEHLSWRFDPPNRRQKMIDQSRDLCLQVSCHGIGERDGRWYVLTAELLHKGEEVHTFGRVDCADLDHNGDILIGAEGRLMRYSAHSQNGAFRVAETEIADLNGLKFAARIAPYTKVSPS